jgi:hypothetical protein
MGVFIPSTRRHYRRLILLLILLHVSVVETKTISQPTSLDGEPTFKANGTWKLHTKIKTSPITATTSTKQRVTKPITITLTIF